MARRDFLKRAASLVIIPLLVWGMVMVYAVAHDQYIVRIAPEHFTVYHHGIGGVSDPDILAWRYAAGAAVVPGLAFGWALAVVSQVGRLPRTRISFTLVVAAAVVVMTEVAAATSGVIAYALGRPLYPASFYPDRALPLIITQTIQITCYIVSALGVLGAIIWVPYYRMTNRE